MCQNSYALRTDQPTDAISDERRRWHPGKAKTHSYREGLFLAIQQRILFAWAALSLLTAKRDLFPQRLGDPPAPGLFKRGRGQILRQRAFSNAVAEEAVDARQGSSIDRFELIRTDRRAKPGK